MSEFSVKKKKKTCGSLTIVVDIGSIALGTFLDIFEGKMKIVKFNGE